MADAFAMAADLLDRVVAHYTSKGATLPEARYVAPGDSRTIAYDGPALQVCVDYLSPGRPGADLAAQPAGQRFHGLRYAQFAVTVLREVAVFDEQGNPPAGARIQADAQANAADLALVQAALETVRDGCLSPGGWAPRGSPVAVGRTQSVGPQGGVVAAVGVIQAEVS